MQQNFFFLNFNLSKIYILLSPLCRKNPNYSFIVKHAHKLYSSLSINYNNNLNCYLGDYGNIGLLNQCNITNI